MLDDSGIQYVGEEGTTADGEDHINFLRDLFSVEEGGFADEK